MPRLRLAPFAFLLALFTPWVLASAAPAAGQAVTAEDAQRRIVEIDRDLADLDDVARKIRGENYRVVIGGTMGDPQAILVSPEQVESLFVSALLNGSMRPEQAARFAQGFGVLTREYLTEIDAELQRLRNQRARLAGALSDAGLPSPPLTTTPVPTSLQGSASGKWSAGCSWNDPDIARSTDGGTFTITFDGRGGVSGTYQSSSSAYGVTGTIAANGSANGSGTGAGWSVNWSGTFQQQGGAITGGGGLSVGITDFGGGSCTGTWAVP